MPYNLLLNRTRGELRTLCHTLIAAQRVALRAQSRKPRYAGGGPPLRVKPFCLGNTDMALSLDRARWDKTRGYWKYPLQQSLRSFYREQDTT